MTSARPAIPTSHTLTTPLSHTPTAVLSGAPTTSLISSSSCSVTVEVQLSPDGTPPIQAILFNFTSPPGYPTQRLNGPFFPGDTIKGTLSGLVGSTEYRLTAAAINSAGTGPSSDAIIFKTGNYYAHQLTASFPLHQVTHSHSTRELLVNIPWRLGYFNKICSLLQQPISACQPLS